MQQIEKQTKHKKQQQKNTHTKHIKQTNKQVKWQTNSFHLNIGFIESRLKTINSYFILPDRDYSDLMWVNCTSYLSDQLENIQRDALCTVCVENPTFYCLTKRDLYT